MDPKIHTIRRKEKNSSRSINLLYWNADGMENFYSLDVNTKNILLSCQIIGISETWEKEKLIKCPAYLNEYTMLQVLAVREAEKGRGSGGLLLFIKNDSKNENYKILDRNDWWITVEVIMNGKKFIFTHTYLSPRLHEAEVVSKLSDHLNFVLLCNPQAPVILMGDLNARVGVLNQMVSESLLGSNLTASRHSLDSRTINKRGKLLVHELEAIGFVLINGRTRSDSPAGYTYISRLGCSTVDHAWVSMSGINWINDSETRPHGTASPHAMYLLKTNLVDSSSLKPDNTSVPNRQAKIEKYRWPDDRDIGENFKDQLEFSWTRIQGSDMDTDHLENAIKTAIKVAASLCKMCSVSTAVNRKSLLDHRWMDKECRELKNQTKFLFTIAKSSHFQEEDKRRFLDAKRHMAQTVKEKKRRTRENELAALSNAKSSSEFWSVIKRYKRHSTPACPISIKSWEDYYIKQYTAKSLQIYPAFREAWHPFLDQEISSEECRKCLSYPKNNKAPGEDNLTNEFYKNLSESGILILTNLFNLILKTGEVPDSWGKIKNIVLFKKGDRMDPGNYRNIALFNCITKIYTQILAKRFSNWAEENEILPEWQCSFREKRCCSDNLYCLKSAIDLITKKKGRYLYCLFVDFRAAFDSVPHDKLWEKLNYLGMSSKALNSIINLYSKLKLQYVINDQTSNLLTVNRGVPQGESLSPLLFALYICDLETKLRSLGISGLGLGGLLEILTLGFADDLVFLAETPVLLQRILDALAPLCEDLGLMVNVKKTQIMRFHRSPRCSESPTFTFRGNEIKITHKYTYLGVEFTSSGRFLAAARDRISKANKAVGTTRQLLYSVNPNTLHPATKLFNSIVKSTLLYASEIWADGYNDMLEPVQAMYFKSILGWSNKTPDYIVRLELSLTKLEVEVLKRKLNWWSKLLKMSVNRLLYKCYQMMLTKHRLNPNSSNLNWVSRLHSTFQDLGFNDIFEAQDADLIELWKNSILDRLTQKIRTNDCISAANSSSCPLYHRLLSIIPDSNAYLYFNINMKQLGLISQCRVISRVIYVTKPRLKWKGKTLELDEFSECQLCGTGEFDTAEHFWTGCIALDPLREKYLPELRHDTDILTISSHERAINLFNFVTKAIILKLS